MMFSQLLFQSAADNAGRHPPNDRLLNSADAAVATEAT